MNWKSVCMVMVEGKSSYKIYLFFYFGEIKGDWFDV